MIIIDLLLFLIVGCLGGLLAGLLGIGGGLIFVPAQLLIYTLRSIPLELQMKMAIGNSLVAILFGSLFAGFFQAKRGAVEWPILYKISFGVVLGSLLGSFLARVVPSRELEIFFGAFEIFLGLYFFFKKSSKNSEIQKKINTTTLNIFGLGIGAISALLGVGGGFFSVPTLVYFRLPLVKAIGTSSFIGAVAAFFGGLAFLFPSFGTDNYPYAIGYLYLPAAIPMTIGSLFTVKWGVHLSHTLPKDKLKRIFAWILIFVGFSMLIR